MSTALERAALHAVSTRCTAAEAVAWFAPGTPPDGQVIGYALSPSAASWVRVHDDGAVERVDAAGNALAEAYEMVLFDGERELRWLRTPDGRGIAVALGEEPARLPDGDPASATPPRRAKGTVRRRLDGVATPHSRAGWTTLSRSRRRHAPAHLPGTFPERARIEVEVVEYVIKDEHGNLDVVESRTVGLRSVTSETAPGRTAVTTSQEGATA
ncbi:CRISPR-associated protein Csx19 [Micromonospora sp. RTGN7]|uniref:type III-D CRISPR-associated protein Csx19 n=1 Tax=Micromonospora sp. RTGN7 TaxID=3016526 RepID=UPI0029FF539D|nr:CRISPR-associated protein Csx19 [Micromonospora sp. RTGN7]